MPHVDVPVGAHYGWRDWLVQRITALVMAGYSALLVGLALWNGGFGYATWKSIFAGNAFRVATFLFMASLLWHAWVGVRNILMDYVKPAGVRLTFECLAVAVLIGYLGWTIAVLWGGA
ncbi:MAG TPA: succinate dehydrogenase, hydrophobic membrane anchor protein [Casimicrobiaceae bacterium]|jgi:succinate dehydrogenase / fumarate reductase membrane anchor subunit|nr:succinate dehydrogenase, hydrophobic membrane anchor protein [Casimicrobiaceae bacterium]